MKFLAWEYSSENTFHIQLSNTSYYKKNDLLHWVKWDAKVIKVYGNQWWRRLLRKVGLNIKINQLKIEVLKVN